MNGDEQLFGKNGSEYEEKNAASEPSLLNSYDSSAAKHRFNTIGFAFAIFTVIVFVATQLLASLAIVAEGLTGIPITSSNLFLNAVTPVAIYLLPYPY